MALAHGALVLWHNSANSPVVAKAVETTSAKRIEVLTHLIGTLGDPEVQARLKRLAALKDEILARGQESPAPASESTTPKSKTTGRRSSDNRVAMSSAALRAAVLQAFTGLIGSRTVRDLTLTVQDLTQREVPEAVVSECLQKLAAESMPLVARVKPGCYISTIIPKDVEERVNARLRKLELEPISAVPRRPLRLRGGTIKQAVIQVLQRANGPMPVQSIHMAVEQELSQPISKDTISSCLTTGCIGDSAIFERVGVGVYRYVLDEE